MIRRNVASIGHSRRPVGGGLWRKEGVSCARHPLRSANCLWRWIFARSCATGASKSPPSATLTRPTPICIDQLRLGFSFSMLALIAIVFFGACSRGEKRAASGEEGKTMAIQLASPAFTEGKPIPAKYTCDAEDLSPPLKWEGLPEGTRSIAIICDDPDAPMRTWVHWVIYDIPASVTELPEGVPKTEVLPNGAKQGVTDFKRTGYGGPCPPPGKPHRYFFKIYALDAQLNLEPRANKKDVLSAMRGHVLGEGGLMGTYKR